MSNILFAKEKAFTFVCIADLYAVAAVMVANDIPFSVQNTYHGNMWDIGYDMKVNRNWKDNVEVPRVLRAARHFEIELEVMKYLVSLINPTQNEIYIGKRIK